MSASPRKPVPVAGSRFDCPHCGEESVVQKKVIRDGWKAAGEVLVCGLCGAELGPAPADPAAAAAQAAMDKTQRAAGILGTTVEKKTLDWGQKAGFCRDCKHFLAHPFQCRCLHWNRPTDPMSDCSTFAPKPPEIKPPAA